MNMEMNMERPKTRGDLVVNLKKGITCEVAEYVAEMTKNMLIGWLHFSSFKTYKSKNKGWVIFEPCVIVHD